MATAQKTIDQVQTLIAKAELIKGSKFVGLRNYTNSKGEVSNQVILAGFSYEKCLEKDLKSLQEKNKLVFEKLGKKYDAELIKKAYFNLYQSLEKRLSDDDVKEALRQANDVTIGQSDAQIDAYRHIAKGVKQHKETRQIFIFGLSVSKTVIVPIEYAKVNSRELTLCQNEIKKICKFRQLKYREFKFNEGEVMISGEAI